MLENKEKGFESNLHSFRVGDKVAWTEEALRNASKDLYDSVLVLPDQILEVVRIDIARNSVDLSDKLGRVFPANPEMIQHLN